MKNILISLCCLVMSLGGLQAQGGCEAEVDFSSFNAGWGRWNDGGTHSIRTSLNGDYCLRIAYNQSSSKITSNAFDLSPHNTATLGFKYYSSGYDNNEYFELQASDNGGSTFATIKTWTRGIDFSNSTWYEELLSIPPQYLVSNAKFRFKSFASSSSEYIYFNDIYINASSTLVADCGVPASFAYSGNIEQGAVLSWDAPGSAVSGYQFQYKEAGFTGDWVELPVVNHTVNLPALLSRTEYETRVKVVCGAGCTTGFIAFGNFPPPSDKDGIQNGDEEGIDCGGTTGVPCIDQCETVQSQAFDNDLGSWTGSNVSYYNGDARLDNNSILRSPSMNLTGVESLNIYFSLDQINLEEYNKLELYIKDNQTGASTKVKTWTHYFDNQIPSFLAYTHTGNIPTDVQVELKCITSQTYTFVSVSSASIEKCFTAKEPSCLDGIQNGNETGVDCGGSCQPCTTLQDCSQMEVLHEENFSGNASS